jgi:hypothetical protein
MNLETLNTRYRDSVSVLKHVAGSSSWVVCQRGKPPVTWLECLFRPSAMPAQGWKVHLSLSAREAPWLADEVLPLLLEERISFKVAADVETIVNLNSGRAGRTQVGKVLTIYPEDDQRAGEIARKLDERFPSTNGPAVISDLRLRPGSAVSLRYGSFHGHMLVDRFGKTLPALKSPEGILVEDVRSETGEQPSWALPPLPALAPHTEDAIDSIIEVEGVGYLPLILLSESPCGRVILALSVNDASRFVVKHRTNGMGLGDPGTQCKSEFETLRLLWSQDPVCPRPISCVPGPHASILVTEYLAGRSLSELEEHQIPSGLHQLSIAIQRLHAMGYAHRDIKPANVILTETGARLIDLELAAPFGTEGLVPAGTYGYVPPEGADGAHASGDVFASGICVAHIFLAMDPASVPEGRGRLIGLLRLSNKHAAAVLTERLTAPAPEQRPSIGQAVDLIAALPEKNDGERGRPRAVDKRWCLRIARESAEVATGLSPTYQEGIAEDSSDREVYNAEGINTGAAGAVLGLMSIDHACHHDGLAEKIHRNAEWLASRAPEQNAHGYFTGNAGVALALQVASGRCHTHEWSAAAELRSVRSLDCLDDCDLFSGVAGVLWATTSLCQLRHVPELQRKAAICADRLMQRAYIVDGLLVWPPAQQNDVPATGAAHGSAGIALALACWGRWANDSAALSMALETFQRLHRSGLDDTGQTLMRTVEARPAKAPILSWCHGVAGYLWCMLLAFGADSRIADATEWCLERCARTWHIGCPVICHGIAGELELWRIVGGFSKWSSSAGLRADRAAGILRLQLLRQQGKPCWASEEPQSIRPDLWVGSLGASTQLAMYAKGSPHSLLSIEWLSEVAIGYP